MRGSLSGFCLHCRVEGWWYMKGGGSQGARKGLCRVLRTHAQSAPFSKSSNSLYIPKCPMQQPPTRPADTTPPRFPPTAVLYLHVEYSHTHSLFIIDINRHIYVYTCAYIVSAVWDASSSHGVCRDAAYRQPLSVS